MKKFKLLVLLLMSLSFVGCAALGFSNEHIEAVPSVEGDHPLVGVWEWTESENWLYVFNADGNGSSGIGRIIQHFTWEVRDDNVLVLAFTTMDTVWHEYWDMQLEGNILLITNTNDNSRRHTYIRVVGS